MSHPQFAAGLDNEEINISSHRTEGKMCSNVRSDGAGALIL